MSELNDSQLNSRQVKVGSARGFQLFLGGVGFGALLAGLQNVLFPWLIVGVLDESAERLGWAQMFAMLPALFFVLKGGAISESSHLGKLLFRLYLLYLLPYLLLILLVVTDSINYLWVTIFGVSYGFITAFVQPARESLLPKVAQEKMRTAVARTSLVQFVCQSTGMLLAGRMNEIGLINLALFQVATLIVCAVLYRRSFMECEFVIDKSAPKKTGQIRAGLRLVWRDRPLRSLMAVMSITGFLGLGVYLVAMPLLAREVYQAGVFFYSSLQLTFMAGVITSNILVMRRVGSHWQPGRFLLISLLIRGLLLGSISTGLPAWLLFPVVLLWGVFSGWSMVMGRTLSHELSPLSHRSRVVSVYQLCLFGAAPIGAWACGQLVEQIGILNAITIFSVVTMIAALLMFWRSALWDLKTNHQE
jgi:MFS family permease